jgi:hypothetical protein
VWHLSSSELAGVTITAGDSEEKLTGTDHEDTPLPENVGYCTSHGIHDLYYGTEYPPLANLWWNAVGSLCGFICHRQTCITVLVCLKCYLEEFQPNVGGGCVTRWSILGIMSPPSFSCLIPKLT